MITQRAKYALKALMALGDERAGDNLPLSIEEVARRSGTPKRFLEQILLELRNAGIVASARGRFGGYTLIQEPRAVSLPEVLRLVDGPIAPLPCLSRRAYQRCADCEDEAKCRLKRLFGEVFWSYLILIESLTLADLLGADPVLEPLLSAGE